MSKTILDHAKEILYDRKEEKERQYGPFKESMAKAADVASVLAGHKLSANDIYAALIGVKLAREGFSHKYDNILDCIVYLSQMSDELEIHKTSFEIFYPTDHATEKVSTTVKNSVKKSNTNRGRKTRKAAKR